jgi:hypothetical protein
MAWRARAEDALAIGRGMGRTGSREERLDLVDLRPGQHGLVLDEHFGEELVNI